ncbi:MAG TPA: rod shape-determining protein MreC [Nitriliruptorales bacterium]
MYPRRRSRVLLAVLVLVTLVLITVDFRSGDDGPLSSLRGLATTVLGPVQDGLATVLSPIANAIGGIGDLFDLREENTRLQSRLEELEARRRSFEDLLQENAELRDLLETRDRGQFDVVAARVIALGPSNYEFTITLDVGSDHGVQRDMPVVNGEGLVGRVIQVTPNASRVMLAIDPNFSAAAGAARNREKGWVDGRGGDLMQFRLFEPEAEIEPGEEIVTSSYSNGVFPSGIPIGTVESVGEQTTLLSREVSVRPYVHFTRLDFVLVVLRAPIPEPPPPEDNPDVPFEPPVIPSPSEQPAPDPSASPGTEA